MPSAGLADGSRLLSRSKEFQPAERPAIDNRKEAKSLCAIHFSESPDAEIVSSTQFCVMPASLPRAACKAQIEQLVQLNEGQPYTYDRPALIKMLDTALVGHDRDRSD